MTSAKSGLLRNELNLTGIARQGCRLGLLQPQRCWTGSYPHGDRRSEAGLD